MPTQRSFDGMKALSIWQPWATLIAIEAKGWETRGWYTPYRGPILIHASKRWTSDQRESQEWAASQVDITSMVTLERLAELDAEPMVLGAYLAIADLTDCQATSLRGDHGEPCSKLWVRQLLDIERELGDFSDGRFGWHFENVTRFYPPIPGRGLQGLFDPPDDVMSIVKQMIGVYESIT